MESESTQRSPMERSYTETMKIYNTLTKRIEEIVPIEDGKIKMYSCGPTVYRFIHIGNLRTFTMADWIRRTFEYRGFQVLHVKNIPMLVICDRRCWTAGRTN